MPLRIAFDLDGTIADMNATLKKEAAALFRPEPVSKTLQTGAKPGQAAAARDTKGEPTREPDDLRLSARQQMQLWDHVKKIENFWMGLDEVEPGIVKRI